MIKRIICSLVIFLLVGCSNYQINEDNKINIKIKSIGIDNIVTISSINDDINGIVLFSEYGRPDSKLDNTIIGAHSGYGDNAYFNKLSLLKEGEKIEILYDGLIYLYEVKRVYEVSFEDTYILDNDIYKKLTLITCKIGDINKRIVVDASYIGKI